MATAEVPKSAIVSQPEHHGSGRSKFTTFKIETDFGGGQNSTVRRRYSDFYWLQQYLLAEKAGVIVPVYSHKIALSIKDKFDEEFVGDRLASLSRFMKRVIDHPDLVDATCLYQFLTLNPRDWVKLKESGDVEAATKRANSNESLGEDESMTKADSSTIVIDAAELANPVQEKKRGWGQWMKDTRAKIAISRGTFQLEENPAEEKKRTDLEEYVDHLETCIQILSADVKGLIEAEEIQAQKMQTMGAAFTELWGEHTLQNTSSSNMYQKVGDSWASLSRMIEKQAHASKRELDDPLEELVLEVLALKQACEKRKTILVNFSKAVRDNRTLQQQFDKLRYKDLSGAQQEQFFQLEKDMKTSDVSMAKLKSFMELVTYRLDRDVDRFRLDFHERMRSVMHQFHASQFDFYANSVMPTWAAPLPYLKPTQLEAAPSQPQLKAAPVAPKLKMTHSTTGAQVSFGEEDNNNGNYTPSVSVTPSRPSIFDRSYDGPPTPPPSAFPAPPEAPPPADVPVSIVPDFSDEDAFGSMSILGEAPASTMEELGSPENPPMEVTKKTPAVPQTTPPPEDSSSPPAMTSPPEDAPPPAAAPPPLSLENPSHEVTEETPSSPKTPPPTEVDTSSPELAMSPDAPPPAAAPPPPPSPT